MSSIFEKSVCRLICGNDKATAFLVHQQYAVTATHAVKEYRLANKEINLEFLNLSEEPLIITAIPVNDRASSPITILKLEQQLNNCSYPLFCNKKIEKDDEYEIFGYPTVKQRVGGWFKSTVIRRIEEGMTQPYDWDIDLKNESNIEDFSGLSGSPLFVDSKLVGVILTQNDTQGKAISLGAISVAKFELELDEVGLQIENNFEYDGYLTYEVSGDIDYSESVFIAALESANIFDHKDCQQEFFNAEIARSIVESKVNNNEIRKFVELKTNVHGLWKTQYRKYKDENDGNDLLAGVYERVEDLSETTLGPYGNYSLIIKKGLLHQLADETKLGWVKNYEVKLKNYIEGGRKQ